MTDWSKQVRKDDLTAGAALIASLIYLALAITGFAFWLGWFGGYS